VKDNCFDDMKMNVKTLAACDKEIAHSDPRVLQGEVT
jgi:hypothetical protein